MSMAKNENLDAMMSFIFWRLTILKNLFFKLEIRQLLRINKFLRQNETQIETLLGTIHDGLYNIFIGNI